MKREGTDARAATPRATGEMTHDEIVAFFDRHQAAYDNLDAATLSADYAGDCVVESPMAGTHRGRAAVERIPPQNDERVCPRCGFKARYTYLRCPECNTPRA